MRNKRISFCLLVCILLSLPLTAMAQTFDPAQQGSISVTLASPDGDEPMAGAELSLYYVATVEANAAGDLVYCCTDVFAKGGITLDDPDLIATLDGFVLDDTISSQKTVTDAQGSAQWSELPLGLYFVKQTGAAEGFAQCAPFLVTVPMTTEEGYQYDVDASPKTQVLRLIDITIRKKWNVDRDIEIPDSVTVQLLRGETVVETVTLNEDNQWQTICAGLPESDDYHIKEVNVPQGFTATYTQSGYTFTVTNTDTLVYTGQTIWPIPVFALAGIVLLMVGFVLLRKSGKHHA